MDLADSMLEQPRWCHRATLGQTVGDFPGQWTKGFLHIQPSRVVRTEVRNRPIDVTTRPTVALDQCDRRSPSAAAQSRARERRLTVRSPSQRVGGDPTFRFVLPLDTCFFRAPRLRYRSRRTRRKLCLEKRKWTTTVRSSPLSGRAWRRGRPGHQATVPARKWSPSQRFLVPGELGTFQRSIDLRGPLPRPFQPLLLIADPTGLSDVTRPPPVG